MRSYELRGDTRNPRGHTGAVEVYPRRTMTDQSGTSARHHGPDDAGTPPHLGAHHAETCLGAHHAETCLGAHHAETYLAARRPLGSLETGRANRTWWDAEAADYHVEHGAFLGDDDFVWGPEGWTEHDLDLLGEVVDRDVLEIGAGAGQCSRWLRSRGARVVASDLSGGMKKRVGLARTLALQPEVLLYDEPTTGLDPINTARINNLIRGIKRALGLTSVVVTHDMGTAFSVSDRIVMIGKGRLIMEGTPEDFRRTQNPYVRDFIDGKAPEDEDVSVLLSTS